MKSIINSFIIFISTILATSHSLASDNDATSKQTAKTLLRHLVCLETMKEQDLNEKYRMTASYQWTIEQNGELLKAQFINIKNKQPVCGSMEINKSLVADNGTSLYEMADKLTPAVKLIVAGKNANEIDKKYFLEATKTQNNNQNWHSLGLKEPKKIYKNINYNDKVAIEYAKLEEDKEAKEESIASNISASSATGNNDSKSISYNNHEYDEDETEENTNSEENNNGSKESNKNEADISSTDKNDIYNRSSNNYNQNKPGANKNYDKNKIKDIDEGYNPYPPLPTDNKNDGYIDINLPQEFPIDTDDEPITFPFPDKDVQDAIDNEIKNKISDYIKQAAGPSPAYTYQDDIIPKGVRISREFCIGDKEMCKQSDEMWQHAVTGLSPKIDIPIPIPSPPKKKCHKVLGFIKVCR